MKTHAGVRGSTNCGPARSITPGIVLGIQETMLEQLIAASPDSTRYRDLLQSWRATSPSSADEAAANAEIMAKLMDELNPGASGQDYIDLCEWYAGRGHAEATTGSDPRASRYGNVAAVAVVTVANGGDNIGVYAPLFATRSGADIAAIGVVFAGMTLVWLAVTGWLINHRTLGVPIRRYGRGVAPFVLIGLGALIVFEAGSFELLGR